MMASATNANPPTTPSSANHQATFNGSRDGQTRQTKPGNVKMTDRGRKDSPADTGRRPPPQKAWTGGTNPLTQKAGTPVHQNGSALQSKPIAAQKPFHQDGGLSDKHSHDRLCYLLGASVGLNMVFTTRTGDRFEGILSGSTLAPNSAKFTFQMTKKLAKSATSQANGVASQEAALVGASPNHAMTFDLKDMADLSISQFALPEAARQTNGTTTSFQTDTDISGNSQRGERVLQKWVPDGPDTTDFSLESGHIGTWDQFEAHKRRFGDTSTYDENLYTTSINRSAPNYAQREADARKLAQAINAEQSTNDHVREERGHANEGELEDEEDKYSGVRRGDRAFPSLPVGGANKYTPPARRAPTALPTVHGAPVDSAIISAQLSRPDATRSSAPKITSAINEVSNATVIPDQAKKASDVAEPAEKKAVADHASKLVTLVTPGPPETHPVNSNTTTQPKTNADDPTDNVEKKVLDQFRQFATSERQRVRAKASQDRTAKLNDLLRFHRTFKLKTPIPTDLVGILAKDPVKQEAIIEKAQKEHEEAKSAPENTKSTVVGSTASPATSSKIPAVPKFDASQIPPPIPDRASVNRARGGLPQHQARNDRATQQPSGSRAVPPFTLTQRTASQQERKSLVPAPIPLPDNRAPPTGPSADHNPSPQRSNMHTPSSAASSKFNAKAMEFRPNANAPAFNPSSASNAPSSPASVQRTSSISRTASPSSFFGARKLKTNKEHVSIATTFNSIERMRKEQEKRKTEKTGEIVKDYSFNGGIPNAYHTAPTWTVREANSNKKYQDAFNRPVGHVSPNQSRSSSAQHVPFPGQMLPSASMSGMPHLPTQAGPPGSLYNQHFDEHRMPMQGAAQVYPSPGMSMRQMSNFSSPMGHQAQLAYGQPQFYGAPAGQMPLQMRQYSGTPGMLHAQPGSMTAPMMVQQQSSGPYMTVPPQYNQMPMYSPNPGHVFPQQNGYPSPGRMAPMMMHQGSQQGHHAGQPMMYAMPGQAAPMMYANQASQMMNVPRNYGGYPGQYGSSPHQAHQMQQRALSSGYGQKGIPQSMMQGQGPPANAPQQPAAFGQMEVGNEDAK